jgi:hypothetical protein
MRLTFTFLIICLIISCKSNIRQNENSSQVLNKDNCPEKTYTKNLDGFRLDAIYYECEPGWKSHLKIYHGDRLIYTADTLTEFDFNKVSWPDFLKVSNDTSQILLEVDDRPSINYIL